MSITWWVDNERVVHFPIQLLRIIKVSGKWIDLKQSSQVRWSRPEKTSSACSSQTKGNFVFKWTSTYEFGVLRNVHMNSSLGFCWVYRWIWENLHFNYSMSFYSGNAFFLFLSFILDIFYGLNWVCLPCPSSFLHSLPPFFFSFLSDSSLCWLVLSQHKEEPSNREEPQQRKGLL